MHESVVFTGDDERWYAYVAKHRSLIDGVQHECRAAQCVGRTLSLGEQCRLQRGERLRNRYFVHVRATALDVGEKSGRVVHSGR